MKQNRFNAIFLDRDGTIIKDRHYLKDPDQIAFEERAISALQLLLQASCQLFICTNQSGIGR